MNLALVGNPNTGKSSLFNRLTGLNQKVGNYPGVTVDKKIGTFKLPNKQRVRLIDLPGCYSLYPSSQDEEVVLQTLLHSKGEDYPDAIIVIADASNLKRNLLLATQVIDLGFPTVLALTMNDEALKKHLKLDLDAIAEKLGIRPVLVNGRTGNGVGELLEAIAEASVSSNEHLLFDPSHDHSAYITELTSNLKESNAYKAWLQGLSLLTPTGAYSGEELDQIAKKHAIHRKRAQVKETIRRYEVIDEILKASVETTDTASTSFTDRLDAILTHRFYGFIVFFILLAIVFQAIFSWSTWPMEMIEWMFEELSAQSQQHLPEGPIADLISEGILPGLAGVLVFIPQIAILFGFIALLEESGYMSRVVFIMDKLMRRFGLSGKSVVPLISGMACAIPAIMATRTIDTWKERLITILVTPFTTCSARLPVYTIIIALVIPSTEIFGFLNLQGLVLMAMYVFGFVLAVTAAVVFDRVIKTKRTGFLMLEMPPYRLPQARNVGLTMFEKVKAFVVGAGKIILAISIVLWALASYGPSDARQQARAEVEQEALANNWNESERDQAIGAAELKSSYIGIVGQKIEPVIAPLGYDWKIGIALLTSFAAREVFVGTIATIYAVGDPENELSIKEKMSADMNPRTNQPLFSLATGISLLLFYALAMQCMSTVAVVKRETKSWKWPLIQFAVMTVMAYLISLIAYQLIA
jgi:ferrous iron transport protein B